MLTAAATRSLPDSLALPADTVTTARELGRGGWTHSAIGAQLAARRWRRVGRAIVRHNGPLRQDERQQVALLNCGPRAMLASFTATEIHGLRGWERDCVHVLVPGGTRIVRPAEISLRVHYTGSWREPAGAGRAVQERAAALVLAASGFATPRPACGILAAGVQQRLVVPDQVEAVLLASSRVRHHRLLTYAIHDIAAGAQALSEIDLVALCRRFGLPLPVHQAVRIEPNGRRRYLDAEWERADGSRVAVEVDGALHLSPRRWWDDQLRQNELTIGGTPVLRFPTVVLRTDPAVVADQLRRLLRV